MREKRTLVSVQNHLQLPLVRLGGGHKRMPHSGAVKL